MNMFVKEKRGITLIALVITIIILTILTSIGIGSVSLVKENIQKSKDTIAMSDLAKVQQLVMENYVRYKQSGNERILKGTKVEYSEAQEELKKIDSGLMLRKKDSSNPEEWYYKLQNLQLKEMGIENVDDDVYIVNYSTGEVFNITQKRTGLGNLLYKSAK